MSVLDKISDLTKEVISFLEEVDKSVDIFKDIIQDSGEPKIPQALNDEQVCRLLEESDNLSYRNRCALTTYRLLANAMSEYSDYLTQNSNIADEELVIGSLTYISNIFDLLSTFFASIERIKWKNNYDEIIFSFGFLVDLIENEKELDEEYSFEFLSDVAKLWDIIVTIADVVNTESKKQLLSESIDEIFPQLSELNESVINLILSDMSSRKKLKYIKKFRKKLYTITRALSSLFSIESKILQCAKYTV